MGYIMIVLDIGVKMTNLAEDEEEDLTIRGMITYLQDAKLNYIDDLLDLLAERCTDPNFCMTVMDKYNDLKEYNDDMERERQELSNYDMYGRHK